MPHLLNHRSAITSSCFTTRRSARSLCSIYSVGLRLLPPHLVNTTTSSGSNVNGKKHKTIICMANPRRVKMVSKQINRELSDMLLTDKVLQYAVLPEAALGADRYLSSLTTISDVEVSADLQVIAILDKIKDGNEKKTTEDGEFADGNNDDVEWKSDGVDDEGIIYVD